MRKTLIAMLVVPMIGAAGAGAAAASGGSAHPSVEGCGASSSTTACENASSVSAPSTLRSVTAQQASSRTRPGGSVVLRFRDVEGDTTALDVGEPGNSPGDTLFFDNSLRDSSDSTTVGRFVSRCTQVTDSAYHCQGTLLLDGSQLDLATTTEFRGAAGIVASVVGGTGQYAGVGGEARITPTSAPGTSRLVVRLLDR